MSIIFPFLKDHGAREWNPLNSIRPPTQTAYQRYILTENAVEPLDSIAVEYLTKFTQIIFDRDINEWVLVNSTESILSTQFFTIPAYQDFTDVTTDTLTLTENQNAFDLNGDPTPIILDENILIVSNSATITKASDPLEYPFNSAFFSKIITANNTNNSVILSDIPKTADKDDIRIYYLIRVKINKIPVKYDMFPKNVRVDLDALDLAGLATDEELEEASPTQFNPQHIYVSKQGNDDYNGQVNRKKATILNALEETDNQSSVIVDIDTGYWNETLTLGTLYTRRTLFGQLDRTVISRMITLNEACTQAQINNIKFENTDSSIDVNLRFGLNITSSLGGFVIANCTVGGNHQCPTVINVASGGSGFITIINCDFSNKILNLTNTATPRLCFINNVANLIVNAGTGWIVVVDNNSQNIFEASSNNNILRGKIANSILSNSTEYNAVVSLGTAGDGYYLANYAESGVFAKGDIILRQHPITIVDSKHYNAQSNVYVLSTQQTAFKDSGEWKTTSVNFVNFQETNTVFVDENYGSDANDGLSIYSKVATLGEALSIAGTGWTIKLLGKTSYSYNSNITLNNLTLDLGEATLTGTFSFFGNGLKIVNGTLNATFTDQSSGTVEINNVNLTNTTINHSNSGNKYYANILQLPIAINTSNGTGVLFFDKDATPFNVNISGSWTINSNFQSTGVDSIVLNDSDLNTIIETGFYACNNIINGPHNVVDGTLSVIKRNDLRVQQEFTFVGSASNVPVRKWIRISYGNPLQWGSWSFAVSASTDNLSGNRMVQTESGGLSIVATIPINEVSLFTQQTSSNLTNYPIGSIILAQDLEGLGYARNSNVIVKYSTSIWRYVTGGSSGTLLTGTWRSRGRITQSNAPILMQRVL